MEFSTSLNQFLLDWGLGLVVFGTDCIAGSLELHYSLNCMYW